MTRTEHINTLLQTNGIGLKSREWMLEHRIDAGWMLFGNFGLCGPGDVRPAFSDIEERWIFLNDANLEEPVSYFVALHEIGHIMTRDQSPCWAKFKAYKSRKLCEYIITRDEEVKAEELAWGWATYEAITVTDPMLQFKDFCLRSYRSGDITIDDIGGAIQEANTSENAMA